MIQTLIQISILALITFTAFSSIYANAASGGTNSTIIADFSATPVSGVAPLTVQFKDSSSGSPTVWEWDFGDGTSSTYTKKTDPTHIYSSAGF